MKNGHVVALLTGSMLCSGQTAPVRDPTLDAAGLPAYVRAIPKPAPEPWRKITEKERFENYAYNGFGPTAVLGSAVGAAFSQWLNSPEEWGQGWGAYGKRVGNSYAGSVIGNSIIYGTSIIFHDDNRFFRSQKSEVKARIGYVALSPIIARNDHGGKRFSTSSALGAVGAAAIPRYWAPPSWQGWSNVLSAAAIWYGQRAGMNFAREFYPDIVRAFKHKKQKGQPKPATPPKKP